jgi:acyl carrier protein
VSTHHLSVTEVEHWLRDRLAFHLEVPPADLHSDQRLPALDIDSIQAITLAGEISDRFELQVDPLVVWDHPTVGAFAIHIHQQLLTADANHAAPGRDHGH